MSNRIRTTRRPLVSLLLVIGVSTAASRTEGQGLNQEKAMELGREHMKDSLRGLKSILVTVDVSPHLTNTISNDTAKTRIELALRKASIKVIKQDEFLKEPLHSGCLAVQIQSIPNAESGFVVIARAQVLQFVLIARSFEDAKSINEVAERARIATTWESAGSTTRLGRLRLGEVRTEIDDQVDEFVNAFLAANERAPKKRP